MKIVKFTIPFLCLIILGCVNIPQVSIDIKRYVLEPEGEFSPADTTLDLSLRVAPFSSDAIYRGARIIYTTSPGVMDYYYYHRWIAPPEYQLADLLTSNLQDWGLFSKGVFQDVNGLTPFHEIQCRLTSLCAVNIKREYSAVLEIYIYVNAVNRTTYEKSTVFQKKYSLRLERDNDNVSSFIEAANILVGQWLQEVRSDLKPLFTKRAG